jgi:hypothetical protein
MYLCTVFEKIQSFPILAPKSTASAPVFVSAPVSCSERLCLRPLPHLLSTTARLYLCLCLCLCLCHLHSLCSLCPLSKERGLVDSTRHLCAGVGVRMLLLFVLLFVGTAAGTAAIAPHAAAAAAYTAGTALAAAARTARLHLHPEWSWVGAGSAGHPPLRPSCSRPR